MNRVLVPALLLTASAAGVSIVKTIRRVVCSP